MGFVKRHTYMKELLAYTERMTRNLLASLPDGTFEFEDFLDEDGITQNPVKIKAAVTIQGDRADHRFQRISPSATGEHQCSVCDHTLGSFLCFSLPIGEKEVPNNAGCLAPIQVIAPLGTVVNAIRPAPVAGGNVETSQRIVDVLFGALAQACPQCIPAASQGTMSNVTIGGWDGLRGKTFTYYETIGGWMGARPEFGGTFRRPFPHDEHPQHPNRSLGICLSVTHLAI